MILYNKNNVNIAENDDELLVLEDDSELIDDRVKITASASLPPVPELESWKVAIVDDDPAVHQATKLALKTFIFENKPLTFLSAYSGAEAQQLIADRSDIAFIFLDVVMETNDAGLKVVRYIREELKNQNVQIILRTGQPGEAPEESVIIAYEINDYKLKTELTRQKLVTATISALRAYRNAIALEQQSAILTKTLRDLEKTQFQLIQSEKMSTLGYLIAGIAHEINNPLGWISGNLSLLEESVRDLLGIIKFYHQKFPEIGATVEELIDLEYLREDLPKMIASTKEGSNRLRYLSSSLNNFSKTNSPTKISFNLHEAIESAILILRHRLKANNTRPAIEVVKKYGNLPLVECFVGQINIVFMNLLSNAIDALKESNQGRSFEEIILNPNRITIQTAMQDEKHVVIRIRDNGLGMSEAVKQRAFDPLFTTKSAQKQTGLGLAIVHQIVVENHGGTIEVESSPGQGSEFAVILPV